MDWATIVYRVRYYQRNIEDLVNWIHINRRGFWGQSSVSQSNNCESNSKTKEIQKKSNRVRARHIRKKRFLERIHFDLDSKWCLGLIGGKVEDTLSIREITWIRCGLSVVWGLWREGHHTVLCSMEERSLVLCWDLNETDLFQSCGHCWVFQMCWHIECSTFTASSFRIWNSSTEFHHLH